MKREENGLALASSSSHRENATTENRKMKTKAVGCMSALFHFLNSRKFKRLTLGKTEEKKKEIIRSNGEKINRKKIKPSVSKSSDESFSSPLSLFSSCADPRSPALPTELRRSEEESAAAEKRRLLVEALERCDRDLKALKNIINAVRSGDDDGRSDLADEPSPVSVLLNNFLASPSPFALRRSLPCYSYGHGHEKKQQQFIVRQQKKKPGEKEFFSNTNIFDQITCESLQRKSPARIADIISHNNHNSIEAKLKDSQVMASSISSPPRNNKATKEVVEEVFRDMAWGQKREIGRIGFALQDHIFRDMVEEIVMEFGYSFNVHRKMYSLPFEACKRRLSF